MQTIDDNTKPFQHQNVCFNSGTSIPQQSKIIWDSTNAPPFHSAVQQVNVTLLNIFSTNRHSYFSSDTSIAQSHLALLSQSAAQTDSLLSLYSVQYQSIGFNSEHTFYKGTPKKGNNENALLLWGDDLVLAEADSVQTPTGDVCVSSMLRCSKE